MRNIFTILKHNLKSTLKKWVWLIVIIPVVANMFIDKLINTMAQDGSLEPSIGVYSNDKSDIFDKFIGKDKFEDIEILDSEKRVRDYVSDGYISVGVIINSNDIYSDVKNNKENIVEVLSLEDDSDKNLVLSNVNNEIIKISSLGNNKEEFIKEYNKFENQKYKISSDSNDLPHTLTTITSFGLFCMAFIFIAGLGLSPLIKERESKIDKRILVSKVSKVEYALGHIIGCFIILVLQSLAFVTSFYKFNPNFDVNFSWMILISVVLSVVGIAIGLVVLSVSSNSQVYYTILSIVGTPMALLSGGFIPLEFMPKIAQNISMFFPLTWINSALKAIIMNEGYKVVLIDLGVALSMSILLIMLYLLVESKRKVRA